MKLRDLARSFLEPVYPPIHPPTILGKKSRGIGEAISRLNHEAELLIEEVSRAQRPIHDTINEVAERLK